MCEFCQQEKIIFEKEIISPCSWGWGGDTMIKEIDASVDQFGVFIDRGYLRFCYLDDCQCLDHGNKVKINFCPFCGEKIE